MSGTLYESRELDLGISSRVQAVCLKSEVSLMPWLRMLLLFFFGASVLGAFGGSPFSQVTIGDASWARVTVDSIARQGREEWIVISFKGTQPLLDCAPRSACLIDAGPATSAVTPQLSTNESAFSVRLVPLKVGKHNLVIAQGPRLARVRRFAFP